jgi:hypothetical protein
MACALELPELASRNPFIADLERQGYLLDFVNGFLIIYGVPYLDKDGGLEYGDWVSPVDLTEDGYLNPPSSHQAHFRGGKPHDGTGKQRSMSSQDVKTPVAENFETDITFSFKHKGDNNQLRDYVSFEEKALTYLEMIAGPAMTKYPEATPLRAIEKMAAAQGSPLKYPDTLSAKYKMNDLSSLLRGKKIAIIGLGGTGSYILDFLAKTHLEKIALFDNDKVYIDTIFRMPGYIHRAIGQKKVDALAQHYGNWHARIEPVPERITEANIDRLQEFDFTFVSIDDGPSRLLIVDWLTAKSIPFVDCGMGLVRVKGGLNGLTRITGVDRAAFDRTVGTVRLPTSKTREDEYHKQAQIAELNALNAAWAVVRFKQHFGLFSRVDDAVSYIFETSSFELDAFGRAA